MGAKSNDEPPDLELMAAVSHRLLMELREIRAECDALRVELWNLRCHRSGRGHYGQNEIGS